VRFVKDVVGRKLGRLLASRGFRGFRSLKGYGSFFGFYKKIAG